MATSKTLEPLTTLEARAWHAYHCLPRDRDGEPPPSTKLELDHGLARGKLGKIFRKGSPQIGTKLLEKVAAALNVGPRWLLDGVGQPPPLTGPLPPRPGTFQGVQVVALPVQDEPASTIPDWDRSAMEALKEQPALERFVREAGDLPLPDAYRLDRASVKLVLRLARILSDKERTRVERLTHLSRVDRQSETMPTGKK